MLIRVLQEKTVRWLQSKVNEDFFLCCWLTTLSIYNPLMGLIYGEVSNNAKKKKKLTLNHHWKHYPAKLCKPSNQYSQFGKEKAKT